MNKFIQKIANFLKISGTTVSTDTSFRDEYPPSNLLSTKERKIKGFLAERFVRAPVSITLHFKTPIFLSHISFNTTAGQTHQSAVYEISVAQYSADLESLEFIKVGRTNFMKNTKHNHHASVTCSFTNFHFPGNKFKKASADGGNSKEQFMPVFRLKNTDENLKGVSSLKITILKTIDANSSPSLSDLKVCGRVSFLYKQLAIPKSIIDELFRNWEVVKQKESREPDSEDFSKFTFFKSNESSASSNPDCNKRPNDKELEREKHNTCSGDPIEFLDSLTSTLMDVPMVLPCGQFVDRKNLDKYVENEAKFGRKPNDPFTGKPFTNSSYPIFDGKLKSRIDEYVLNKNGISFSSLKNKRKQDYQHLHDLRKKSRCNLKNGDNTELSEIRAHSSQIVNSNLSCLKSVENNTPDLNSQKSDEIDAQRSDNDLVISTSKATDKKDTISKVDNIFKTVLSGKKPIINIKTVTNKVSSTLTQNAVTNSVKSSENIGSILTNLPKSNHPVYKKYIKCSMCFDKAINNPESLDDKNRQKYLYQVVVCKHIFCRHCIEIMFKTSDKGKRL